MLQGTYFRPPTESKKNFGGKLPDRVKNVKYGLSKNGGSLPLVTQSISVVPNKTHKFTVPAEVAGKTACYFNLF